MLHRDPCSPSRERPEQQVTAVRRGRQWYAVFDGMGGEACGDRASYAAASALARHGWRLAWGKPDKALMNVTHRLQSAVAGALGGARGGCTMALALFRGRRIYAAHAGDSRVYLYHERSLTRLTRDHTMDALFSRGSRGAAGRSHALIRYLGNPPPEFPGCEITAARVCRRDRVLICSDGLTDMVADGLILRRLTEEPDAAHAAQRLVDDALEAGGKDNVTVVVADIC